MHIANVMVVSRAVGNDVGAVIKSCATEFPSESDKSSCGRARADIARAGEIIADIARAGEANALFG
jgi:hypothetical protein